MNDHGDGTKPFRIGYNPDHSEALEHVDMGYAPVVGEEFLIALKKENGAGRWLNQQCCGFPDP